MHDLWGNGIFIAGEQVLPFTIEDLEDLLRLLDQHPDWKEALVRRLLSPDLLAAPTQIQESWKQIQALRAVVEEFFRRSQGEINALREMQGTLAETVSLLVQRFENLVHQLMGLTESHQRLLDFQERLAQSVDALAQSHEQLVQRVDALAESHERLVQRVDALAESHERLAQRVDALAESHERLVQRVDALAESHERLAQRVDALAESHERLVQRVDALAKSHEELAKSQEALTRSHESLVARVDSLIQTVQELSEQIRRVEQDLSRLTDELSRLTTWQGGEAARREGERYERDIVRSAVRLFRGGQGGPADHPVIQDLFRRYLAPHIKPEDWDGFPDPKSDPSYADLIWMKGDKVAVVEVSITVDENDVQRAAERAQTLRSVGLDAFGVVIGKYWEGLAVRQEAKFRRVEWWIQSEGRPSDGLIAFLALPP